MLICELESYYIKMRSCESRKGCTIHLLNIAIAVDKLLIKSFFNILYLAQFYHTLFNTSVFLLSNLLHSIPFYSTPSFSISFNLYHSIFHSILFYIISIFITQSLSSPSPSPSPSFKSPSPFISIFHSIIFSFQLFIHFSITPLSSLSSLSFHTIPYHTIP